VYNATMWAYLKNWIRGRTAGWWVLLLAAAAFAVRLQLAIRFLRTPYHEFTLHIAGPDQNRFLLWAEGMRAGHWELPGSTASMAFQFSPAYPFLLSLSLANQAQPFLGILLFQALMSALVTLALWDLGKKLGCRAGGIAAAIGWALYAPGAYFDACLMRESLLASSGFLAFWAAVRSWERVSASRVLIAGGLLGFCTALRPHLFFILLPAFFCASAFFGKRDWRRMAGGVGIFVVACAVISPITIYNWRAAHHWVPVSTQGADALILGNDPDGPGVSFVPTVNSLAMLKRSGDTVGGAARVIAKEFLNKPREALELYGRKLRMLVNDYEVPDNYSFYVWRMLTRPPKWLMGGWGLMFPAACLGLWGALRGPIRWRMAAGCAMVFFAGAAVIHIQSRYRFVAVPFLMLLAGYGAAQIARSASRGQWLKAGAALVLAGLIGFAIRPLPSFGYHRVTGSDGVERLSQDVIREVDYVTLLASWSLSDARAHAPVIRLMSNRAYRSYGLAVVQQFDLSMRALYQNLDGVLSRAYREKYGIQNTNNLFQLISG
jgi:hypothetical protein